MAPLPWSQEEETLASNPDLPDNFDDRDFQELFSPSEAPPIALQVPVPSIHQQTAQSQQTRSAVQQRPLVNLQMIVDPVSGSVTYPRQVLTYDLGFGKVETVMFGPVTLEANHQDVKQSDSVVNHTPLSFPALPALDGRQLQQLQQFSPLCSSMSPRLSPSDIITEAIASNSRDFASLSSATSIPSTEGTPVRALSAYNWFFRDERDRILNGGDCEWTRDKQTRLLASHWHQDRSKKRRHRKTHGKINFTTLSKLVSQRWKDLNDSQKQFYRQVATEDFQRYQREMDEYKRRLGTSPCPGLCFSQVVG